MLLTFRAFNTILNTNKHRHFNNWYTLTFCQLLSLFVWIIKRDFSDLCTGCNVTVPGRDVTECSETVCRDQKIPLQRLNRSNSRNNTGSSTHRPSIRKWNRWLETNQWEWEHCTQGCWQQSKLDTLRFFSTHLSGFTTSNCGCSLCGFHRTSPVVGSTYLRMPGFF